MFVDDPADAPPDVIAFDMRGAELSHHAGDRSFETILRRYGLDDPVLWDVARIVPEADLADERCDGPEAVGVDFVRRSLSMVHGNSEILAVATAVFDGLYEYERRPVLLGRDPG